MVDKFYNIQEIPVLYPLQCSYNVASQMLKFMGRLGITVVCSKQKDNYYWRTLKEDNPT